jgi:hypothetical protein
MTVVPTSASRDGEPDTAPDSDPAANAVPIPPLAGPRRVRPFLPPPGDAPGIDPIPTAPESSDDRAVRDTPSPSATVSAAEPPTERATIVPRYRTPQAEDTPTDGSQPDAPDSNDGAASPPSDGASWDLPTAPQPVVTTSAVAGTRGGSRASITRLLLAVGLVAAVILTSVAVLRRSPDGAAGREGVVGSAPRATNGSGASGESEGGSSNAVSGPLGAIQSAEFQLVTGVSVVVVRTADIGGDLYRAATAEGSGVAPQVVQDGAQIRLRLVRLHDSDSRDSVTIELNTRVRWRLSMIAGSESATVDMRSANLAGVDFIGGVARIEMWLPEPQGDVPVRMSGGVRDFAIHAPGRTAVRVRLARGAAAVTVDGATHSGVASGTRLASSGWSNAPDRYDIDAIAGLAVLTVDRY